MLKTWNSRFRNNMYICILSYFLDFSSTCPRARTCMSPSSRTRARVFCSRRNCGIPIICIHTYYCIFLYPRGDAKVEKTHIFTSKMCLFAHLPPRGRSEGATRRDPAPKCVKRHTFGGGKCVFFHLCVPPWG